MAKDKAPDLVYVNDQGEASMVDPTTGDRVWVPKSNLAKAMSQGFSAETPDAYRSRKREEELGQQTGAALAAGLARGATLGLSDLALTATGAVSPETLAGLERANPIASGIGDVAGSVGSALIPGAPLARVGAIGAKAGGRLAEKIATRGLTKRIVNTGVRTGVEGAALGTGRGISDVAMSKDMTASQIAKRILKGTAGGAAAGFGLGVAGMGLAGAAKFAGSRAQQIAGKLKLDSKKTAALNAERDALTREISAIGKPANSAAEKALTKAEARLAKVTEKLSTNESGWAAKLVRGAAEDRARQAIGFGVGTLVGGGPIGGFIGSQIAPKIMRAVSRAAEPVVTKVSPYVARSATVAGKLAESAIKTQTPKALTAKDFSEISRQLKTMDPISVAERVKASAPAGADQELAETAAARSADLVAFLQEKLPMPPPEDIDRAPSGSAEWTPSSKEMHRFGTYLRASMDPESIAVDFQSGRLTREAVEAGNRLHPSVMEEMREVVSDEMRKAEARGDRFSRNQARQMAVLMGDPSLAPRMYDPAVVQRLQDNFNVEQQQKAAMGGSVTLDQNLLSKMQRLRA